MGTSRIRQIVSLSRVQTNVGGFELKESGLVRCLRCCNIITIYLDIDGNLVLLDLNDKRHSCSNLNVVDKSDGLAPSRLIDELFLHLIRTRYQDQKTGELKRSYLEQARDLIYKIPVYNPPPLFLVHLGDIQDDKIKHELANLDDSTREHVLSDSIGLIFESVNEHYYNLSVRNLLQWKIVA
jgi:hypothetical protein